MRSDSVVERRVLRCEWPGAASEAGCRWWGDWSWLYLLRPRLFALADGVDEAWDLSGVGGISLGELEWER